MINLLSGIDCTAAALAAERIRMDVVTQNIANANTVRGLDGKPYQRQQVVFETVLRDRLAASAGPGASAASTVQVARVEADTRPPRLVFDPYRGTVEMPNINVHEEMADLITSSRAFEANLAVLKTARSMAMQTLSIGKR